MIDCTKLQEILLLRIGGPSDWNRGQGLLKPYRSELEELAKRLDIKCISHYDMPELLIKIFSSTRTVEDKKIIDANLRKYYFITASDIIRHYKLNDNEYSLLRHARVLPRIGTLTPSGGLGFERNVFDPSLILDEKHFYYLLNYAKKAESAAHEKYRRADVDYNFMINQADFAVLPKMFVRILSNKDYQEGQTIHYIVTSGQGCIIPEANDKAINNIYRIMCVEQSSNLKAGYVALSIEEVRR